MRYRKALYIIPLELVLVAVAVVIILACFSSPVPPTCARTIYLAKSSPGTVLLPAGGTTAAVGVLPFVSWDAGNPTACAQPTAASIDLTLTCTPAGGGTPVVLGPVNFAAATPTVPGAQPVPGGTLAFPIPAGTAPGGCTVTGTYNVTFGGAAGGATPLAGTGDTEVCLVEPSPDDPDLPRIELSEIDTGADASYQGDRTFHLFKIANNDLNEPATVALNSDGRQVAGFPDGITTDDDAYNAGVFRISNTDGDVFPAEFFFDELPFERVPGDPLSGDPGMIQQDLTLEPGEVDIFGIAINSFGACADGSCNERTLGADVVFGDVNSPAGNARICANILHRVDNNVPPRYPGLTVRDDIKVHPQVDAQWSPASFFDPAGNLIDETHLGNLLPVQIVDELQPGPALQTTGDILQEQFFQPFAATSTNQITLPQGWESVQYSLFNFDQRDNFVTQLNRVTVRGLGQQEFPCAVPAISFDPGQAATELDIILDSDGLCGQGSAVQIDQVFDGVPERIFEGTLGDLENDPIFKVDHETCRTFSFPEGNHLDDRFLIADPPVKALNLEGELPITERLDILDDLFSGAAFEAEVDGPPGLTLGSTSGTGELIFEVDPSVFVPGLETREWTLTIRNDDAINSPVTVPIIARRRVPPPIVLPPPDVIFDSPPLARAGEMYTVPVSIPPINPTPADPFIDMEVIFSIVTGDPLVFSGPGPFPVTPVNGNTSADEADRLRAKFGDDPINECISGLRQCGKIEFGDGFTFETEIFADGFESGDVSAWSTGAAADNSQRTDKETPVGVLDADKKLPVFTEEELRQAIELFNDDVVFDEKTIGLVSDRFDIDVPLPPIRGTYFFDEFESFRKGGTPVTMDGTNCPAPCSGLMVEASGVHVSGIRFEHFPSYGIEVAADSTQVTNSAFAGNTMGGVLIASGTGNTVLSSTFEGNAGPALDLGGDGVTPNDPGDADTGPNNLQNFPELTLVAATDSTATIEGTLDSTPDAAFTVQLFAGAACNPSGNGGGARLLGTTTVATDAGGTGFFSVTIDSMLTRGEEITATATDAGGNTSEFSACFAVGTASEAVAGDLPASYSLMPNYPNPFNPATTIRYAVPVASPVRIVVYDLLGRQVAVLVDAVRPAGEHTVVFDAAGLPSGTYLYTMRSGRFAETHTLILLK